MEYTRNVIAMSITSSFSSLSQVQTFITVYNVCVVLIDDTLPASAECCNGIMSLTLHFFFPGGPSK